MPSWTLAGSERRAARLIAACGIGLLAATLFLFVHHLAPMRLPDIGILLEVSRGYLHGQNAYDVMGPGRAVEFPEQMAYPFTEVLLLAPFALLPVWIGGAAVVAIGSGLWGWALTGAARYRPALVGGASLAALFVAGEGQWSALLMAAALMPTFGWLLAIKPTIGLALFAGFPSTRTAFGVVAFCVVALLLDPHWPWKWYESTHSVQHLVAIVTRPGGVLVLLALLRWREAPARVLVALACIPHTTLPYETLYLFLVPQTWGRAWLLCGLSYLTPMIVGPTDPMTHIYVQRYADAILWTAYLPCVVMLLVPPRTMAARSSSTMAVPKSL